MSSIAAAVVLTLIFQQVLRRNKGYWDRHRAAAALLGSVSLLLWVTVIAAGRWIAYVAHG
jgi:hypothetical protein